MHIEFFEENQALDLWPISSTRPVAEIRVGILSVAEKWVRKLNASVSYQTRSYLSNKFPSATHEADLFLLGNVLPSDSLLSELNSLENNTSLIVGDRLVAYKGVKSKEKKVNIPLVSIDRPYHIFKLAGEEIKNDFDLITTEKSSETLSSTNTKIGEYPVYLETGAKAECSIFNSTDGPIYIGKNAQVMEGSIIRGPFAMGEGSNVKMGSKIYSNTSLGPYCNVGGELNNVVMQGYSNKGHDGFLGNAVLGEWCNIGADSNCSNLKNTYDQVKVWNYRSNRFEKSSEQFCGLIMGDHSKCGINTMFNTGTVVGVGCNLFGAGFPRQFVPDFSWGGSSGFTTHKLPQMEKTAGLMMVRRNKKYNQNEQSIFRAVYELSKEWRNWED